MFWPLFNQCREIKLTFLVIVTLALHSPQSPHYSIGDHLRKLWGISMRSCILDVKMFLLRAYVFSQIWLEAFKVNKLLHLKTVFFPFGSSLRFHSLFHRYLKYVLENLPERLLLQKLTMVKFLNDQRHHTLIGRTTWRHRLCFFLTKLSDATVVKFKVCQ